jgi:hypothetical protein
MEAMARKRKVASAASLAPVSFAEPLQIELSEKTTRTCSWYLFAVTASLLVLDVLLNYAQLIEAPQIRRLFNIAREDSLANWLSSLLFLLVCLTVSATAFFSYRAKQSIQTVRLWTLFSFFFLFLAADDGAKIHERVGPVARDLAARAPAGEMPWYGHYIDWVGGYTWHAVVLPFFVLIGIGLFVFCWKQFRNPFLRGMLFLACMLMAVAVGLDYFEGWFRNVPGDTFAGWDRYTVSHFQKATEEFLEMTASCVLFYVFSTHCLSVFQHVELHAVAFDGKFPSRKNRR